MLETATRVSEIIVAKLRVRTPDADTDSLQKSMAELDLDSLDIVELTQTLEVELEVEADLEKTSSFDYLRELVDYFTDLVGAK
ncbi:phosphopantetheine-binding protein [Nocardia sp. NPDC052566]|uniref:phosphopantetheine-binding protein n=1 Tax=Nocardia sp. NPDC052566 TaxID=3364330 RepID=UPI0037C799AA